ncbi:MAG: caspase domain-containing protein [Bacteroidota bacterium]
MKFWLSFFLSVGLLSLSGQNIINISGIWKGSSSYMNETSAVIMEFRQSENLVEGYIYGKSLNGNDSTKKAFNGVITGNQIEILETDYIYRVGIDCKAKINLEFSIRDGKEQLSGKWSGDLRLSTCPPGTFGPINLVRAKGVQGKLPVVHISEEEISEAQQSKVVKPTDEVGQVLVSELSKRKYYGLFIGIDEYADPNIQTLDNPIRDAQELVDVLSSGYSFDDGDIIFLQNPNRAEIIDALDELTEKATGRDNVLIFYAGHGVWNEKLNQGYWLPADASLDSKSQWLSNSTLRDYLGGIKSKHTLLISDACFSGGILKERAVEENSKAMLELYKLPSRKAMTSGTMTTVPDESVFIRYLVKNLKTNEAKLLSADQLFRNFKIAVINNSPRGLVPQYGVIAFTGDEGGDFIFMKKE